LPEGGVKEASEGFFYPSGGFCILGGDFVNREEFKRKLTAILSADVEGYSRRMRDDEEATIRTLTTYRTAMTGLIQQYRGRVVDSPGDNILAEFTSAVDAVNCAVEMQRELAERNAVLPTERRMEFRIGVNVGDVVEEEERIYGDGVNIAARMEGLAEGGGICISGTAYDQVKHKLGLEYEYLGEQEVKNIEEPVPAYRVLSFPGAAAHRVVKAKRGLGRTWRNVVVAVAAVLVLGAALVVWKFYLRPTPIESALVDRMAYPLPEKPSVAVLPLTNMSGDPEQEYFSDGLTEEIITALSKSDNMFVIARNSTFTYKGKAVKIKQVAEEMGVRYVLEGSVRKSGDRVRITAQLIDALRGNHLWAERYDRELKEIFALQDEITMKITTALQVKLTEGEQARMWEKGTDNLDAYLKRLQARERFRRFNKDDNVLARKLAEEAVSLDPNYAAAYAMLAWTHALDARIGWTDSLKQSVAQAEELAKKALALDDALPNGRQVQGFIFLMKRQYDEAIAEEQRTVTLNPNGADAHALLGMALVFACRPLEAIEVLKKAIRLNPLPPSYYFVKLGRAYRMTEQYNRAIESYEKALNRSPVDLFAHVELAATYALLGQEEKAREKAADVLKLHPKFSIERYTKGVPFRERSETERLAKALRSAGLPETPPLPLPDKPSIAVLPFVNMSGDPEQEYFSDGMTEQIITALAKSPDLFVISRSSTFTYKEKSVKAQQVSRDLGVRYVVEGSVQKAGEQVRITAQLIDAKTGHHLWAESYDRGLRDIFALQDEITIKIMSSLRAKLLLTREGEPRSLAPGTKNLQSYLKFMKAGHYFVRGSADDYSLARRLAEEAIALDPEYPSPYGILAWTHLLDATLGTSKSPRNSMGKAFRLAQKHVEMDEFSAPAHGILGNVYMFKREHDKAIAEFERAIALDPNYPQGYMFLADALTFAGRPQEAIPLYKKSMRLSPLSQRQASMSLYRLGRAYHNMGKYEEALSALKKAANIRPNFWAIQLTLAATYIHLGREEEARAAAAELRRIVPTFTLERFAERRLMKDEAEFGRLIDALRKAGLE
jgi:adenylate cyclase